MADQSAEECLVQPVHVLERVDHREARFGAEVHGGVAVRQVQIDQDRRPAGSSCASAVATLVATVVVPTPPFAPMKAKTSPLVLGAVDVVTRVTAAERSGAVTGAVRNSVTPARMASSISAGSSERRYDHDAGGGVLTPKHADRRGKRRPVAHVQDDERRLRSAGLSQRGQLFNLADRHAEPARLHQLFELPVPRSCERRCQ